MNLLFNSLSYSLTSIDSSPKLVWSCGIHYFLEEAPERLFIYFLFINILAISKVLFFIPTNLFEKVGTALGSTCVLISEKPAMRNFHPIGPL